MTDEYPKDPNDQAGINRFTYSALVEADDRFLEIEQAHAMLALRLLRLLAPSLGLNDDEITNVLLQHSEEIRSAAGRHFGNAPWKSVVAQRVEDAGRHLDPMPRPLGADFRTPPWEIAPGTAPGSD